MGLNSVGSVVPAMSARSPAGTVQGAWSSTMQTFPMQLCRNAATSRIGAEGTGQGQRGTKGRGQVPRKETDSEQERNNEKKNALDAYEGYAPNWGCKSGKGTRTTWITNSRRGPRSTIPDAPGQNILNEVCTGPCGDGHGSAELHHADIPDATLELTKGYAHNLWHKSAWGPAGTVKGAGSSTMQSAPRRSRRQRRRTPRMRLTPDAPQQQHQQQQQQRYKYDWMRYSGYTLDATSRPISPYAMLPLHQRILAKLPDAHSCLRPEEGARGSAQAGNEF